MTRLILLLLPAVLTGLLSLARPPEPLLGALATLAILCMPGWAWTRGGDVLERLLRAGWIGAVCAVPCVLVGAWSGLGAWGALATAAVITLAGALRSPTPSGPLAPGPRLGLQVLVAALLLLAWKERVTLARPLERHAWIPEASEAPFAGTLPDAVLGFRGGRDGSALRIQPLRTEAQLVGPMRAPVLLVLRAPVEASLEAGGKVRRIGAPAEGARRVVVEAAPEVNPEEGPVARYLERGAAALMLTEDLDAGETLTLRFDAPRQSVLHVIPSREALWDLHARGELRMVHYYQLLNMQEQVQWSRELLGERRVTDVQPPLWAYLGAGPLGVTAGDLPTQGGVFVFALLMFGASALACVRAWAPEAPLSAWALPAAATWQAGRLMLEPGSFGMPDTLYAAASLGGLAALRGLPGQAGASYAWVGLLAQLLRYPGSFVVALPALLDGQLRRAARMLSLVGAVALLFAVGGWASGSLEGWLRTVAWETGPEHWHGNFAPSVLVAPIPDFLWKLLLYSGFTPVLALLAPLFAGGDSERGRALRVTLGTLIVQALILGTIDHHPSHYFLPLLGLGAVALATAAPRNRWGSWLCVLGLLGFAGSALWVEITG